MDLKQLKENSLLFNISKLRNKYFVMIFIFIYIIKKKNVSRKSDLSHKMMILAF